ncbi:hypothetical protein GW17_00046207 [Ensete ventricosum]|nr:hypothetical protein GW17_00046207 [Ensete ventricosum]RZS11208.1 hypothetical protein BHM03_00042517 [Ensete ventricosum]
MGASRSDAHIGTWSHPASILDCSHWCLPGVPDAWNELVFSHLLTNEISRPRPDIKSRDKTGVVHGDKSREEKERDPQSS